MAATTADKVSAIAPELKDFIDGNSCIVNLFLADVASEVKQGVFGPKQERAQRYLAAHYLTLSNPATSSGSSGAVKREKVGDIEKEYTDASKAKGTQIGYNETSYGRTFLQIRRGCIVGFKNFAP